MVLSYNIPDYLEPYLEFIPEETLCEMISIALEKAITNRSLGAEVEAKPVAQDYTYLLNEITKRFSTAVITAPVAQVVDNPFDIQPTYNFEVVSESSVSGDDETDDLDFDFLNDITK